LGEGGEGGGGGGGEVGGRGGGSDVKTLGLEEFFEKRTA